MDEYLIHYESYLYTEHSQEAAYDVQSPSSFDSSIFSSISNADCLASFIKMIYCTGFIGIQSGTLGTPSFNSSLQTLLKWDNRSFTPMFCCLHCPLGDRNTRHNSAPQQSTKWQDLYNYIWLTENNHKAENSIRINHCSKFMSSDWYKDSLCSIRLWWFFMSLSLSNRQVSRFLSSL